MRHPIALLTLAATLLGASTASAQLSSPPIEQPNPQLRRNEGVLLAVDLRERLAARESEARSRVYQRQLPASLLPWFTAQRATLERELRETARDGTLTPAEQRRLDGIVQAQPPLRVDPLTPREDLLEQRERESTAVLAEARARAQTRERADMQQLERAQRRIQEREREWERERAQHPAQE